MLKCTRILDRDTWQRLHAALGTSHCSSAFKSSPEPSLKPASTNFLASDFFSKPRGDGRRGEAELVGWKRPQTWLFFPENYMDFLCCLS